ncbi:MAG TPA: hypothetical protein VN958_06825 [Chitinophagaceae bacterium]|nr:hypothetical protein [Chitinophagaceae bacterium]
MKKVFFFLMAISFVIGCNPSKRNTSTGTDTTIQPVGDTAMQGDTMKGNPQ